MRKIVLAAGIAALIAGCSSESDFREAGPFQKLGSIDESKSLYCDRATNIVYIKYAAGYRGGLSVYYNAEGKPARCNEVR